MKLLFLYVDNFRVHKARSFNFDANDRFILHDGKLSMVEPESKVPADFFHLAAPGRTDTRFATTSRVDCVSAIIGKNGAGKTSIAEMLNIAFSNGSSGEQFLYIYKIGDVYFCRYNLRRAVDVSEVERMVGRDHWDYCCLDEMGASHDLGIIYYSPYYSPRDDWFIGSADGFVDISTVGKLAGKVPKEYDIEESKTIDRFIVKLASRGSRLKKDAPLPCPGKLTLKVNTGYIESTYREVESLLPDVDFLDTYRGVTEIDESEGMVRVGGQSFNTVSSKEEYLWTLQYMLPVLALVWTGDFLLQTIAGLAASCIRKYGLDYEAFRGNPIIVRLGHLGSAISQKICHENFPGGVCRLHGNQIVERWRAIDERGQRYIRSFAIKCAVSTLLMQHYSTAGRQVINRQLMKSEELKIARLSDGLLVGYVGAFLEALSSFAVDMPPANEYGEIVVALNDRHRRKAYYMLRRFYEKLQINLFAGDSGSFMSFSAVGMSSGEKAYLSLFGRMDDILGTGKKGFRRKSKNWILFLDEAETALHPEWQRGLVENVIWYVENFTRNLNVHVIFASHSPALLSDVPCHNVIFLDSDNESGADKVNVLNTFGANIFDLYRIAFNQHNGPIGTFAKRKIDNALKTIAKHVASKMDGPRRWSDKYYANSDVMDNAMRIVELVGDPLIQRYIESLRNGGLI